MVQTDIPHNRLREHFPCGVILAGDSGYDEARQLWNAAIQRRPEVIVKCQSVQEVASAVTYAVQQGLEISVRGGGHNTAGLAVADGGMMIHLGPLSRVRVDPEQRRASVGGGALLGDLDRASQEHGLAVPAGEVSHTGVGGLTLGGGMGWLTRQYGLSIDNLLGVEIVLADGSIVAADVHRNPDLFWAVRGGGGNFGVVTRFDFRLHPVGPTVHMAMVFFRLDDGAAALRRARDIIGSLPASVSMQIVAVNARPAPFLPKQVHNQLGFALMVIGFGEETEHGEVVDALRRHLDPLFEVRMPMTYVALQQMFDAANAPGAFSYEKGCYVEHLSDEAIDVVIEYIRRKTSLRSVMHFYVLNGAYSQVGDAETAFGGKRSPRLAMFILGIAGDQKALSVEQQWVRDFVAAMEPYADHQGVYVNSMGEGDDNRVRKSYGVKYERLARIKAEVDPTNVFHRNRNIVPAR
jgi:FAD/FMN-containing dehydrogenase